MRESDKKCLKWLTKQGIPKHEITYHPTGAYDFTISDGRRYEAKKASGGAGIILTRNQLREFERTNPIIVVFKDSDKPIAVAPYKKIRRQFSIYLNKGGSKNKIAVFLDPAYVKVLDDLIEAGLAGTRSEAVRFILHDWGRERQKIFTE